MDIFKKSVLISLLIVIVLIPYGSVARAFKLPGPASAPTVVVGAPYYNSDKSTLTVPVTLNGGQTQTTSFTLYTGSDAANKPIYKYTSAISNSQIGTTTSSQKFYRAQTANNGNSEEAAGNQLGSFLIVTPGATDTITYGVTGSSLIDNAHGAKKSGFVLVNDVCMKGCEAITATPEAISQNAEWAVLYAFSSNQATTTQITSPLTGEDKTAVCTRLSTSWESFKESVRSMFIPEPGSSGESKNANWKILTGNTPANAVGSSAEFAKFIGTKVFPWAKGVDPTTSVEIDKLDLTETGVSTAKTIENLAASMNDDIAKLKAANVTKCDGVNFRKFKFDKNLEIQKNENYADLAELSGSIGEVTAFAANAIASLNAPVTTAGSSDACGAISSNTIFQWAFCELILGVKALAEWATCKADAIFSSITNLSNADYAGIGTNCAGAVTKSAATASSSASSGGTGTGGGSSASSGTPTGTATTVDAETKNQAGLKCREVTQRAASPTVGGYTYGAIDAIPVLVSENLNGYCVYAKGIGSTAVANSCIGKKAIILDSSCSFSAAVNAASNTVSNF